ncbi:MAG TPA: hypothetical protein VFI84_04045 [Candidatus Saccharimonadales bacterium]|nr:hypothetical protein [Candidatus Saccharimonadales bacterium]
MMRWFKLGIFVFALFSFIQFFQGHSFALTGYFTGVTDTGGSDFVLPGGTTGNLSIPSSINTVDDFTTYIEDLYNGTDADTACNNMGYSNSTCVAWQRAGAAFIIQTMRGGTDTGWPTDSDITDFENRLAPFANGTPGYTVSWATTFYYDNAPGHAACWNSLSIKDHATGDTNPDDSAYYGDCGSESNTIVFYVNGNPVYAVKHRCGNPVGKLGGIPLVPPSLDGVKIDNSGVGDYGGSYDAVASGEADTGVYTFSDDTVAVNKTTGANVAGDTADPFSMGSITAGTYSLKLTDSGTADTGWALIGYKICDSNNPPAGGCDDTYLTDTSSGVHGNGGNYTFEDGGQYHMRWIFKQTPFSVDGVKIDDSGTGPTGSNSGYGGNCYSATNPAPCNNGSLSSYPFSDNTVSISTNTCNGAVTASSANPFFFTSCNSSGTLAADTYYTVSIADTGTPDNGWRLYGYSICMEGSGCTAGFLTSTNSITQASSFDYPFLGGHTYHIRWIYEQVPAVTFAVTCNSSTGLADASATFVDTGSATSGYVAYGSYPNTAAKTSPASWPSLPGTDWSGYTFSLWVTDRAHDGTVISQDIMATATAGPCATPTCGSYVPQGVEAGSVFNVKVYIDYKASGPPPASYSMNAKVTGPGYASPVYTATYNNADPSGGPPSGSASLAFSFTPPVAGQYDVTWNFLNNGTAVTPPSPCGGTAAPIYVYNVPYFKTYGNDVKAGGAFDAGNCSNSGTGLGHTGFPGGYIGNLDGASIKASNTGNATYTGAGTQFAAYAIGHIAGFSSAAMRSAIGSPGPANGLSFANTTTYGGDVGGSNCIHNYYNDISQASSVTNITTSSVDPRTMAGAYTYSGPTTLSLSSSGPITNGNRSVIYVNGADVYISSAGIQYTTGTGNWTQLSDIPSFWLVVNGGNIYIDPGVTELDGVYVAQPKADGSKGKIFTCADTTGPISPSIITGAAGDPCNNQLTVYGAFIAQEVELLRSYSSLRYATTDEAPVGSHAAEIFNFSPETYLAPPNGLGNSGGSKYDSITELPPVL